MEPKGEGGGNAERGTTGGREGVRREGEGERSGGRKEGKKEKKSRRGDTEDGFPLAFDRFR